MKRISPVLIVMFIAAACCAVMNSLAFHYRTLYRHTTDEAKQKLALESQELTGRLDKRGAEEPRDLTAERVWGRISTTDIAPGYTFESEPHLTVTNGQPLQIDPSKASYGFMLKEIRLPAGSTNVYELEVPSGKAVGVWLINAEPYDNLTAFDQFHAYPTETNTVRLVVQAKPGASVNMEFDLEVLGETVEYY
jgi:hypothetical protein